MSDEEKEAIEIQDSITILENTELDINNIYSIDLRTYNFAVKSVLNLINKQQKEIEEQLAVIRTQTKHEEEYKKEIVDLKDFITKLQATKDRLDAYDKENTFKIEELEEKLKDCDEHYSRLKKFHNHECVTKDKIREKLKYLDEEG